MPECKDIGVHPLGQTSRSEVMWRRLQERTPFPLSVMISLTGRCNARCGHCELILKHSADDELSFAEISPILEQLKEAGVLSVTFTGGEPCLRDDLEGIVADAAAKRFYVTLKTNGTLIDEARSRSLIHAGLGGVHISIYHDVPDMHDAFVGIDGALSAAMNAAAMFKPSGARVQLSLIAMDWNVDAVFRLVDLCENRGYAYMVESQIAPRRGGDKTPLSHQAPRNRLESLFRDPRVLDRKAFASISQRHSDDSVCGAGVGSCYIHHNGELWPCGRLPYSMGNLKSDGFKEIWLTSKVRKEVLGTRWRRLPSCNSCRLSGICSRCLASALSAEGGFVVPDPRECEATRALSAVLDEGDHAPIGKT